MVYKLDKKDPLACEVTYTDWSKVKYSQIPKTVNLCCPDVEEDKAP